MDRSQSEVGRYSLQQKWHPIITLLERRISFTPFCPMKEREKHCTSTIIIIILLINQAQQKREKK